MSAATWYAERAGRMLARDGSRRGEGRPARGADPRARRRLVPVAAAACLLQSALAFAAPPDRAQLLNLSHSVGRVEARLASGRVGVGSAVTVARGVVVTNCHVTRDAVSVRVVGSGMPWSATEQVADELHDLCFLRVPQWPHPPVTLRSAAGLRIGDPVAAVGFTAGAAVTLRTGAVTALHRHEGGQIIESDTAFTSGASGGALFDDHGALVGLLTFRMRGSLAHYYSVPAAWIRDRLPREEEWVEVRPLKGPRPFWQGDLDQLPDFMRAASLQAQGRWVELHDVAQRWCAADRDNPEAHFALGVAWQELAYPHAAAQAMSQAVALAPTHASAWFHLGQAYWSIENRAGLQHVLGELDRLDRPLARQLRAESRTFLSGASAEAGR
jgi:hypothetical protein